MMSATPARRLRPWQRIPASWRCGVCGEPAQGWYAVHGESRFYCADLDHRERIADDLVDRHGFAAGQGRLRDPWRYWLEATFWWRPRHALRRRFTANGRAEARACAAVSDVADSILGAAECDWCQSRNIE